MHCSAQTYPLSAITKKAVLNGQLARRVGQRCRAGLWKPTGLVPNIRPPVAG